MFLVPTMPLAGRVHDRRSTLAVDLPQGMTMHQAARSASDGKLALWRLRR